MKYKINLIAKKQEDFFERIVYFLLNYLRYILVITQIIVIGVFFYKFKVDQEIIDLKETVDQKKEIITISQPLIKEVKAVDFKMNTIETILKDQNKLVDLISYTISNFPQAIRLIKLDISQKELKMEGTTQDINILKSFYMQIKKDNKFKKIDLQNIKKEDFGFSFNMQILL